MDDFPRLILDRLPLAEAVLKVLAYALDHDFLDDLFQRHRGASYTKVIAFPVLTHLLCDALITNRSGRRTFEAARAAQTLPAGVRSAYRKLSRLPVAVSAAVLREGSRRVRDLVPDGAAETPLPKSLAGFAAIVFDGKVAKGVPHRLKPLRTAAGGLVGGRALVAHHLDSGLVVALEAEEDGDANDVRFVASLMPAVRAAYPGRRLALGDRAFSHVPTLAEFARDDGAFVVRHSKAVPFECDDRVAERTGRDEDGRPYREDWGWLGKESNPQRRYVRRIAVDRGDAEAIVVVTNLEDADRYPAVDVLAVYRQRPNIEMVFQRITEVFALRRLIGTSPRATVFQLSLCLLLYNVLQVVRAYLAANAGRTMDEVSPRKVLDDVRDQMASARTLLGAATLAERLGKPGSAEDVRRFLAARLCGWDQRWVKAKRRRNRPPKPKPKRGHASAYRVLQAARRQR